MKFLLLVLCIMLCLSGCSHFFFGSREKDKDEKIMQERTSLQDLTLSKDEIVRFHKATSPNYQQIISNNRAILPPYPLGLSSDFNKHWPLIQADLDYLISTEVKNYINPQADAQKYLNLMLSLIDEKNEYQAIVLESKKEVPYFIGKYIFISRQEIEGCQDEGDLLKILVYRLIRNNLLNNQIDFSQIKNNITLELISTINQEVSKSWEKYATSDLYFPNLEIRIQTALIMNRAAFKPENDEPGNQTSDLTLDSKDQANLMFITPLQRHKKVFD
ncbi:hypothetical protein JEZ13_11265 [bacterium]|nr:hypothetical protein [bacterium]